MRSSIPRYIVGVILLVAIIAFIGKKLTIGSNPGLVRDIVGAPEIRLTGQSAWQPVKLGDEVGTGVALRTPAGSEIDIAWSDNTHVRLAENASLSVAKALANRTSSAEKTQLRLEKGKLWGRLRKATATKRDFEIDAGLLTARVSSATFSLEIRPDGTLKADCHDGSLQLAEGTKDIASVQARMILTLPPGAKKPTLAVMTPDLAAAFAAKRVVAGAFLIVLQPKEGEQVSGDILTVTGLTDPGNTVQINGTPVTTADDGSFTVRLTPRHGQDIIVLARDEEGRQTNIVRKVTY